MLNNQTQMPRIGYGTWQGTDKLDDLVYEAIKIGYRHFDTASIYRNEELVGKGVNRAIQEGLVKREDLYITTKFFPEKDNIPKFLNQSLEKLQLDYIDLYLIHSPFSAYNKETDRFDQPPLHETWKVLEDLVRSGKCKSIGVSNFNVQLLVDLLSYAEIKPVCNQVEVHPYLIQEDLIGFYKKMGIEIVAYTPLGGNFPGDVEVNVKSLIEEPIIKELSEKYGKTPGQVILNWGLSRGYVIIPKTATVSRLRENFECGDFEMTEQELKKISSLNRNARACDPKNMAHVGYVPGFA